MIYFLPMKKITPQITKRILSSVYISFLILNAFIVADVSMCFGGYVDNFKHYMKFSLVSNFFVNAFVFLIIYLIVYLIDKYTKLKFLLITLGICTLITIWFSFNMLSVPPSVPGF